MYETLPFFSGRVLPGYNGVRRPHFFALLAAALTTRIAVAHLPDPDVFVRGADALVVAVLLRQWSGWRPLAGLRTPLVAVLHR